MQNTENMQKFIDSTFDLSPIKTVKSIPKRGERKRRKLTTRSSTKRAHRNIEQTSMNAREQPYANASLARGHTTPSMECVCLCVCVCVCVCVWRLCRSTRYSLARRPSFYHPTLSFLYERIFYSAALDQGSRGRLISQSHCIKPEACIKQPRGDQPVSSKRRHEEAGWPRLCRMAEKKRKKRKRKGKEREFIGRKIKRRCEISAIDVLEDHAGELEDAEACNVNKYAKHPRIICYVMQFYIYIQCVFYIIFIYTYYTLYDVFYIILYIHIIHCIVFYIISCIYIILYTT